MIFDEPSREPLPKEADLNELQYIAMKGVASLVPGGGELVGLLFSSPLTERRDAWFEDLERRLRDLEREVGGFSCDKLAENEQFVSAALSATQAAIRTHQKEKLEALLNAVFNSALGSVKDSDRQQLFISLVDRFTPAHLRLLAGLPPLQPTVDLKWAVGRLEDRNKHWEDVPRWVRDHVPGFESQDQSFIKLIVFDLYACGLTDIPPDSKPESPPGGTVTNLGREFLQFISRPPVAEVGGAEAEDK